MDTTGTWRFVNVECNPQILKKSKDSKGKITAKLNDKLQ